MMKMRLCKKLTLTMRWAIRSSVASGSGEPGIPPSALVPLVLILDRAIGSDLLNLDVGHHGPVQDLPQAAISLMQRDLRVDGALDEQMLNFVFPEGADEGRRQIHLQPVW